MVARAPGTVCPYCKGTGVVVTPTLYAMPVKAVQLAKCGPCQTKNTATTAATVSEQPG